jgi:putative DNA primase/helicase
MTPEAIARQLGGPKAKKSGKGWKTLCPAHEDKDPSLSIGNGDNGKIVVHCHKGCSQDQVIAALRATGITLNGQAREQAEKSARPRIKATYDYVDELGKLLFQSVRYDPKAFKQRRPNGSDWVWNTQGVRVVPYNLPGVIEAISNQQIVCIVEGEKDADNLAKLGIAATCNSGGAKKWRDDHSAFFRGADVVVIPDNDAAGREHAELVAKSLGGIAARIRMLKLPGLSEKGDLSDWIAAGGTREQLDALIAAAPEWTPPQTNGASASNTAGASNSNAKGDQQQHDGAKTSNGTNAGSGATSAKMGRPIIRIAGGELSGMATTAEKHLVAAGAPLYQRGSMLVRPIIEEVPASDERKTKIVALQPVDDVFMRDMLCRHVEWQKLQRRGNAETLTRADPPSDVARTILKRVGEWGFPPIVSASTTPTLRPDGSILSEPGYDAATGLLLVDPPALPSIPEKPTFDDALEALNLLDGLLDEFAFVDEASRSVALSALITPIARGTFSVTPMHASRAPSSGSGKSYVWDVAAAIALGEVCPIIAAGRDEAETEKRLGSTVLQGYPLVSIDNINGELSGDFLCQAIERPIVNVRVLGQSKVVRVVNRQTLFATGNNLRLTGDMPRRSLLCSLDTKLEHPEERVFKADPIESVLADRGKYIAAALTVTRAYIVAGRPGKLKPLASFKGWSDTVRSPLVWLGHTDPVKTIVTVRSEDPDQQALATLLSAWKHIFGIGLDNAHTTNEAIARAQPTHTASHAERDLREAIDNISPRGKPDPKSLGKWLQNRKDRIVSGLRFRQVERVGRSSHWYIEERD